MDIGAIRNAIATWIATVTDLPVKWTERPQSYGASGMWLHIRGFRGVGLDQIDEEYDASTVLSAEWGGITGGFTPTQTGQRVGVLEVRAELQSQENDEDALYYVQLVRDRLGLPSCVDALDAAEAAIGEILLEPRELSNTRDMRRVSIAQMDVAINAASGAAGTPYSNIETVELRTVGQDGDGNTVFETTVEIEV